MLSTLPVITFLPLAFVGLFGAYAVYRMVTMRRGLEPAMREFMEKTGYRVAGASDPSIESSLRVWSAAFEQQRKKASYDVTVWRDAQGWMLTQRTFMGFSDPKSRVYTMAASWQMVARPRVRVHIAEKSLGGMGQRIAGAITSTKRCFEPRYTVPIQTGDAGLDGRFQIWGEDPAAVASVLRYPGLREALLAMPEVDLAIGDEGVVLNDPEQKNLRAGMGGTFGAMAMGGNMGKLLTLSVDVHAKAAHLLVLAAQATA